MYAKLMPKKIISVQNYFTINEAVNSTIDGTKIFILSNEKNTKSGRIGRFYTVFPHFKYFLKNREKYNHCHEILVDHSNNPPENAGRLVFDFDINFPKEKDGYCVPKKFKTQIEGVIYDVVEKYFKNVDPNILEYVWSTSLNPKKFSKHLTVKNLYFDNWLKMSKIFYQLFSIIWDENYTWIKSNNLFDYQIIRKNTSLRMVGSSKINGFALEFDNEKHQLTDSLIRIYFHNQKKNEQIVTIDNLCASVLKNVLEETIDNNNGYDSDFDLGIDINEHTIFTQKKVNIMYDKKVYNKAFKIISKIYPNIFIPGKISGEYMSLIRQKGKSNNCLLSGKLHESENAFLKITQTVNNYSVRFGCFRFYHKKKTIYIGSITIDNLLILISNNLPKYKSNQKNTKKKFKSEEFIYSFN